ncbi:liprin protein kazrin isoform 2-T2 [Glossina fuscipes fuscipes]
MQINGTNTGPTMAASEPPEPPPRNPERINASLHKLNESKTFKSLDDKSVNNNKPLKPLLSLDTANTPLAVAATTITSASATTSLVSTKPTALGLQSPSASVLLFGKQNQKQQQTNSDLTPSGDSNSTLSSNGSNHTLTSPMTIDNQRLNFQHAVATKIETTTGQLIQQQQLMTQQQQQNGNGGCSGGSSNVGQRSIGTLLIDQQQSSHLMNGSSGNGVVGGGGGGGGGSVGGGVGGSISNGSLSIGSSVNGSSANSNHSSSLSGSNTLNSNSLNATNHINSTPIALVDKKNANDIACSSFGHVMDTRYSTDTYNITTPTDGLFASSLATTISNTYAYTAAMLNNSNINNCDGNRNRNDTTKYNYHADSPTKLREENERLNAEIQRLRKLLENSPEGAVGGIDLSDTNSCGDGQSTDGSGGNVQQRIDRLEQELRSVRNQLMSLRLDRKKLKAEKSELLSQVKQLCASLHEKEQELRDFIRNYQDRVRETETNNAKLSGDRERERWQLLKQARDEAERSLALAQQLSARDIQLQRLQEQLQEARRQMSGCLSDQESLLSFAPLTPPSANSGLLNQLPNTATNNFRNDDSGRGNSNSLSAFSSSSGNTTGDRNSCSNDSVLRNNSDRESTGGDLNFSDGTCDNGPCITVDPDSISLVSSQNAYQYGTPKERSPTLSPLNSAAYSRSVEQLGSPVDSDATGAVVRKFPAKSGTNFTARNARGGTWGSISRVFARSRNKNKALSADGATEFTDFSWSPLSEEGYAEKLRLLREASSLPMERWRASQVLAWLEVALGMPQYSTRCAENVKSGKVLLELNDVELENGLGLTHPMHRKKLRLAIEEQRRPELVRYPMITQLGHTWVASEWLPDIGLPQYAESFMHSMVDARMLDTLSKKELEKFLGVTRKFHQASIVHGIHVLRIVKYDRQTLAMRRVQSESVDTDPIVWTNQRFIRWARSIDLSEYADNLKDSGVHGGLVVLEPSFSGDTMATALGIPPSKNIIRRHLSTEFDALILPARYLIYCQMEEIQADNTARPIILNQKSVGR